MAESDRVGSADWVLQRMGTELQVELCKTYLLHHIRRGGAAIVTPDMFSVDVLNQAAQDIGQLRVTQIDYGYRVIQISDKDRVVEALRDAGVYHFKERDGWSLLKVEAALAALEDETGCVFKRHRLGKALWVKRVNMISPDTVALRLRKEDYQETLANLTSWLQDPGRGELYRVSSKHGDKLAHQLRSAGWSCEVSVGTDGLAVLAVSVR